MPPGTLPSTVPGKSTPTGDANAPFVTTDLIPLLVKIVPETLPGPIGASLSRTGTTKTGEKGGPANAPVCVSSLSPRKSPFDTFKNYFATGNTPTNTLVNTSGPDNVVILPGSKVTEGP